MVVQHNITAMNSNRMLNVTSKSQSKSTEKLSSGYKINRAADDAAGLSISEKMRKQIRGLTQASANAQDGISAVQTAEGALTEVHDMLQRMNELAVKSANGTNSKDDRDYIQAEVDQLVTEIDRVATTTKFNETYLLKGTNGTEPGKLAYTSASKFLTGSTTDVFNSDGEVSGKEGTAQAAVADKDDAALKTLTGLTFKTDSAAKIGTITINSKEYTYVQSYTPDTANKETISLDDLVKGFNETNKTAVAANTKGIYTSLEDLANAIKLDSKGELKSATATVDGTSKKIQIAATAFADKNNDLSFSLHVGADSTKDNKIEVNVSMMSARGLGVNGIRVDGTDDTAATKAIDTIAAAIKTVSSQRSALGAVQNRLEHTINNLDNVVENTTSAESAIRDTDMATEMVSYSNNNILAQAGQAMLAQANQSNQGVLSLLG